MPSLPNNPSPSTRRLNPHVYGPSVSPNNSSPPGPEREPGVGHEPLAEGEAEGDGPVRRIVRITSYRCRLLDERNLHDKAFVDALQAAGIIHSDSPTWCKVEVEQRQVGSPDHERTEIEVF